MTNTKGSPKSCSCTQCTRGKHSVVGHSMMKADERAYRHAAKISLKQLGEDAVVSSGPIGNYYD
jgi:hypothetical protein